MQASAELILSASHTRQFPLEGPPEIAFLGRSNVGKSSLLNSLVERSVARVSSTPGRTRTINFYGVHSAGRQGPALRFVDLPGYGYAKLSRTVTAGWPRFIEPYLLERRSLALCVVLLDANVPPQASDLNLARWLQEIGRPMALVATKADRLSGNKLRQALVALQREFAAGDILPYSSRSGAGRPELWRRIRAAAQERQA